MCPRGPFWHPEDIDHQSRSPDHTYPFVLHVGIVFIRARPETGVKGSRTAQLLECVLAPSSYVLLTVMECGQMGHCLAERYTPDQRGQTPSGYQTTHLGILHRILAFSPPLIPLPGASPTGVSTRMMGHPTQSFWSLSLDSLLQVCRAGISRRNLAGAFTAALS